jgi:class 3 adenylate cyclase
MQRKLTAILSADVVGYSGMMEVDETGTLERLKANRARVFAGTGGRQIRFVAGAAASSLMFFHLRPRRQSRSVIRANHDEIWIKRPRITHPQMPHSRFSRFA